MIFSLRHPQRRFCAAFTLIEVILAIVIALGILVVLLYFYQQATNLRAQAIEETEKISAARLVMDRMTSDLRAYQTESTWSRGFTGTSNSIEFVKADVPSFSAWTGGALGRSAFPVTDLRLVRYRLDSVEETNAIGEVSAPSMGGTNEWMGAVGLVRSEEPLVSIRRLASESELDLTNQLANAAAPPLIQEIRHLQFRFWSGTNWIDSWNGTGAPEAVEISLGPDPLTNLTAVAEGEPLEVFQRVVYLGGRGRVASRASNTSATPSKTSSDEEDIP